MRRLTDVLDRAKTEQRFKACAEAKRSAELDGDPGSAAAMSDTIDEILDGWLEHKP